MGRPKRQAQSCRTIRFLNDIDQKYNENVGNSYNTYLIQDLLREELGYEGVVCNESQLKSITMLKNKDSVLPIKRGIKVYVPTRQIRSHLDFMSMPTGD